MNLQNEYNIPPELKDAIPAYMSRRDQDVLSLKTFAASNDFNSISKLAHKLKGNGASFGFDRISDLGSLMMKACENNDELGVKNLVMDFENEIHSIKTAVMQM